MPVLNVIDAAYVGPEPVASIWSGPDKVWPSGGVPQDIQVVQSNMWSNATSTTLTIPNAQMIEARAGDVVYLGLYSFTTVSGFGVSGGGITWTSIGAEQVPVANNRMQLFRGIVESPITTDIVVTANSVPNVLVATSVTVRGVDLDMPEDDDAVSVTVLTTANTSQNVPGPIITTDGAADLLIAMGNNDLSGGTSAFGLTGMQTIMTVGTTTGTDASTIVGLTKDNAPGTGVTATITQAIASAAFTAWRIPLKPATVTAENRAVLEARLPLNLLGTSTANYHQWTTGSTSNVSTNSYTYTPNSLALVFVGASNVDSTLPVTPTVTGGGMTTWDLVDDVVAKGSGDAFRIKGWIFRAQQTNPGSPAPLTVSFSSAPARVSMFTYEIVGVAAAGDNGVSAIGDIVVLDEQLNAVNPGVSLTLDGPRNGVLLYRVHNVVTPSPASTDRMPIELNNGSNNFLSSMLFERRSPDGVSHAIHTTPPGFTGLIGVEIKAPLIVPKARGGAIIQVDSNTLVHAFMSSGRFTPFEDLTADVLAVGGGGGGGGGQGVGGGGGGGVKTSLSAVLTDQTTITVGAKGSGGAFTGASGTAGGDTSVGSLLLAGGGGFGATNGLVGGSADDGASGGGGGGASAGAADTGGAGGTATGGGFNGGRGSGGFSLIVGGGGGGASANGTAADTNNNQAGDGGAGVSSSIWFNLSLGAGGGGGAGGTVTSSASGVGGRGGRQSTAPTSGHPFSGSGGGGGGSTTSSSVRTGGDGSSGLAVIRYDV